MKYTGTYWALFSPFTKRLLGKKYGRECAGEFMKKAKPLYRQMIEEAPDIGDKNPMRANIYMSFVFMAIWKAADGAVSPDDMREITRDLIGMKVVQKFYTNLNINKPSDREKFRQKLIRSGTWAESYPEYKDKSWDFNYDKNSWEVAYYFTRCPINDYARAHGYLEILPAICELDIVLAKLYHAKLYREQTLATGGDKCDYRFVGDENE